MARETRITIETDSLFVFRGPKPLLEWCPQCGAEGEMIPLNEVGVISNLLAQEVEAWIQSDALHHIQTPAGVHFICLSSMLKLIRKSG